MRYDIETKRLTITSNRIHNVRRVCGDGRGDDDGDGDGAEEHGEQESRWGR